MGSHMLGEDIEDQLGSVDHPYGELSLEVPLLPRAQVLVADHEVVMQVVALLADVSDFATPDKEGWFDLFSTLDVRGHYIATGGLSQLGQLPHLLVQHLMGRARELDTDEVGALALGLRIDQMFCSCRNSRIPGTGSSVASNHLICGLRRSHRSWRLAYRRFERAISPASSLSGTSPRMHASASAYPIPVNTGASAGTPEARAARVSSIRPRATWSCERSTSRRSIVARSAISPMRTGVQEGGRRVRSLASGGPATSRTSIARTSRTGLRLSTLASGSRRCSSTASDSRGSRSSSALRFGRGATPASEKPSARASAHSMLPPSTIGSLPRAVMSAIAALAASTNSKTVYVLAGSAVPTR